MRRLSKLRNRSLLFLTLFIGSCFLFIRSENKSSSYSVFDKLGSGSTVHRKALIAGNSSAELSWFVQVTDLHFSASKEKQRLSDFKAFCSWALKAVRPPVFVVSGDLTTEETQILKDWQAYKDVVDTCLKGSSAKWLDLRGNHDTYEVSSLVAENNYFANYSVQGRLYSRSYFTKISQSLGLVAIDSSPIPGPRRPLNYFASLNSEQFEEIESLLNQALRETDTIVTFGHYPLSFHTGNFSPLKRLIKSSVAYLCGHLHTMGGRLPDLYARHPEGLYELELADWAVNRKFRIMAIDHGLFSFRDESFVDGHQTSIVVTNPIDVRFSQQKNACRVTSSSTHVRVLVFSPYDVIKVNLSIDGKSTTQAEKFSEDSTPVYVAPWDPMKFNDNRVHQLLIEVQLKDIDGGQRNVSTSMNFSLCLDVRDDFPAASAVVLKTDITLFIWLCFFATVLGFALPFLFARIVSQLSTQKIDKKSVVVKAWIPIFSETKLFTTAICGSLYILMGPWAVGYFLEHDVGVLFAWGLVINGGLHPSDVGLVYFIFFVAPYLFVFHFISGWKISQKSSVLCSLAYFVLVLVQLFQTIHVFYFYGFLESLGIFGLLKIVYFHLLWTFLEQAIPHSLT